MNIVQITPGAGRMYCGNCFRDNALVAELRRLGHTTLMVPVYLPLRLEEEDQTAGTPVFFGGVNVYLQQLSPFFRTAPKWLHDWLASPTLLRWVAGRAARTRASQVGDLALSMIRGEEGNQARELRELTAWLGTQGHPEVICLSNVLLVGMARQLRRQLDTSVVCMLQGEDTFLDAMPPEFREQAWELIAERAADVDQFIAPSRYFAELMGRRLRLAPDRIRIVPNGIHLEGYAPGDAPMRPPVVGYFARMCPEKGLETLVDAYIQLRRRNRVGRVRLKVGGGCGPADARFVAALRDRLTRVGWARDVEFHPNLERAAKIEFLRSLTVFSVPALFGEAFGLYLLEAMAAAVPVVQPDVASFAEVLGATGGGVLCEPGSPEALAEALESLLLDPPRARTLGQAGRKAVLERFTAQHMARSVAQVYEEVVQRRAGTGPA